MTEERRGLAEENYLLTKEASSTEVSQKKTKRKTIFSPTSKQHRGIAITAKRVRSLSTG